PARWRAVVRPAMTTAFSPNPSRSPPARHRDRRPWDDRGRAETLAAHLLRAPARPAHRPGGRARRAHRLPACRCDRPSPPRARERGPLPPPDSPPPAWRRDRAALPPWRGARRARALEWPPIGAWRPALRRNGAIA